MANLTYQAVATLNAAGLATLASANYATSDTINFTATKPYDCFVEIAATVGAVAGNIRAIEVYASTSLDETNFSTANSNATDATHDSNMRLLGLIPTPNASESVRQSFSIASAFGGFVPPYVRIVVKNNTGAALTAGSARTLQIV